MQIKLYTGIVLMGLAPAISGYAQTAHTSQPADSNSTASALLKGPLFAAISTQPPEPRPGSAFVARSMVFVNAEAEQHNSIDSNDPVPLHATAAEILSSAGTYGDFSRYLQTFPGVVFNTDESNDILVRGGNPLENLFLVDGIEVPNINHISTEAATGGLVSMIDTAAIKDVDLHSGGYNASYEERLSSVVDIHTSELEGDKPHIEGDIGFVGAGGVSEMPLDNGGSLLVSAHRSLLNLFTNDIGLDGVPIYTNFLIRGTLKLNPADTVSIVSLGGLDSINITPQAFDPEETSTIQMQYSGWRTSNGLRWQHIFSPANFGVLTLSDSEQHERINEQDQFFLDSADPDLKSQSDVLVPVYFEHTHDSVMNLRYDAFLGLGSRTNLIAGTSLHFDGINYNIAQPQGEHSVLNADPDRTDADSFTPEFWTKEESSYAEATVKLTHRWSVSGGGRTEFYQFGDHLWFTPRASSSFRISSHTGLHASFGEYRQLPPFVYMTAWPQNYGLSPIRARHIIAGADLYSGRQEQVAIEVYQKNYSDYPVSTEYPTISLANLVDTLGQQFLWLPMTSSGNGITRGVELSGGAHIGAHFSAHANLAWSRAQYSSLDGIMRPGNFDYPIVANVLGTYRSGKRYEASWRYEETSGRPYTPYLLSASEAQDRPIYDVSKINALRGPRYSRLDFEFDRNFTIGGTKHLVAYAGLDNALNHQNLLGYFWMPRLEAKYHYKGDPSEFLTPQYQMQRFPNFGVRYVF